jgi:microsomal prostaglandin-E synthase 2
LQAGAPAQPAVNPYELPSTTQGLPQTILLYQYEVCPFCCKVKAFLDYHNLPYRVVEVNPLTKAELKWSDYKKVPVVLLDGKDQLNDSSAIISRLAAELAAAGSPSGGKQQQQRRRRRGLMSKTPAAGGGGDASAEEEEETRWRRWVDERLVRVITVNIYRNARESFQTFAYIADHGNFSWAQREAARVVGATLMWGLSRRLRKKYGVEGDVREALYGCADEWVGALGGRPFLGGAAPNLADLSTFGVVRSVVGTDTFMDLMHNTGIAPWYERMMAAVGEPARVAEG